jgi:SAM-dependent methyltransferase
VKLFLKLFVYVIRESNLIINIGEVMKNFTEEQKRESIAQNYAKVATSNSCCGSSICDSQSLNLGYSQEQLNSIPSGADKGLGCGNPTMIASLQKGEVVLDLGSGAGLDCFLASKEVGDSGQVIGVDMTREMIAKARDNKNKNDYKIHK